MACKFCIDKIRQHSDPTKWYMSSKDVKWVCIHCKGIAAERAADDGKVFFSFKEAGPELKECSHTMTEINKSKKEFSAAALETRQREEGQGKAKPMMYEYHVLHIKPDCDDRNKLKWDCFKDKLRTLDEERHDVSQCNGVETPEVIANKSLKVVPGQILEERSPTALEKQESAKKCSTATIGTQTWKWKNDEDLISFDEEVYDESQSTGVETPEVNRHKPLKVVAGQILEERSPSGMEKQESAKKCSTAAIGTDTNEEGKTKIMPIAYHILQVKLGCDHCDTLKLKNHKDLISLDEKRHEEAQNKKVETPKVTPSKAVEVQKEQMLKSRWPTERDIKEYVEEFLAAALKKVEREEGQRFFYQ